MYLYVCISLSIVFDMYLYICIHKYVCNCICIYFVFKTCNYLNIHMYFRLYTFLCVCIRLCKRMYSCISMYICLIAHAIMSGCIWKILDIAIVDAIYSIVTHRYHLLHVARHFRSRLDLRRPTQKVPTQSQV